MSTINVSGNQQVQIYDYEYGEGYQPGNPQTPIHSRDPGGDPNVQSDDGQGGSRILKDQWLRPLQSRFEGLANKVDGVANQVAGVAGGVSALNGQVAGVAGNVSTVSGQVAGVAGNISTVSGQVAGLSTKVDEVGNGVTHLQGNVSEQGKSIAQINKDIESLKALAVKNQTSVGNIETTLGTLKPKIESTASEVSGLKEFEQWLKQNGCGSGGSGH